jgi:hypothetical protein
VLIHAVTSNQAVWVFLTGSPDAIAVAEGFRASPPMKRRTKTRCCFNDAKMRKTVKHPNLRY